MSRSGYCEDGMKRKGYEVAPVAAVPAEPSGKLTKSEARQILDLALDLEKTGRIVALTEGQEKSDFIARNRQIQCALTDVLAILTESAATPPIPAPVEGMVLAPHYRGYAELGTGQYLLNHSAAGADCSFIISVATDAEKAGRVVGDERVNHTGALLQPEAMAVRIDFTSVAGLDAMEGQLRKLRTEHFPESSERAPTGPVGSIGDDPEFHSLVADLYTAYDESTTLGVSAPNEKAYGKLLVYIDTLLAASKTGPAKLTEWISVEDRLPGLDVPVWLYEPDRGVWVGGRSDGGEGWLWCNCCGTQFMRNGAWEAQEFDMDDDYMPTLWMPLPDAPVSPQGAADSDGGVDACLPK